MRTMLVPLLQERRRKVRLPLPNPHGSLDRRFYTLSLRRRLPWCVHKRAKYHKLGRKALFTRVSIRETRCEVATRKKNGGRGDRGDRSRRVFTEPPRISHGKINLADTHREGDWTLDAVTGHGLQRLQQIACVKERTAINGCIIQYRGGGRGRGRGEGAGVCVSKCKRERRDANAKGPHHLEERIEEPRNEALDVYIYISPSSKKRERIWAARGSVRRVCALRKTTKPRAYDEKRLLHACGARSTLFPP